MTDPYELSLQVFDNGEARQQLRAATKVVLTLEKAVAEAGEEAADAEGVYRAERAAAFKRHRDAGAAVEAAGIAARGECVKWSRARDVAHTNLKLAFERLEDARDTRRSLWRLVEWSRDVQVARAHAPENVPGDKWP
jgi:hypothetical protein